MQQFVELLHTAGIGAIADVRRHPGSRRQPWFARDALAASLPAHGIAYSHHPELGGRRARASDSPNGGWENASFQGYADWMATPEFAAGVARLEEAAKAAPTATMCAEAQWWRCHRRLLADALLVRDWEVLHVDPSGHASPHELTGFAVVEGGRITYPPAQQALELPRAPG